MKLSLKFVTAALGLSASFLGASADDYIRGRDPQADAIRDIQTGMAGMQHATKDPVLLAQLVQDLQVRFMNLIGGGLFQNKWPFNFTVYENRTRKC